MSDADTEPESDEEQHIIKPTLPPLSAWRPPSPSTDGEEGRSSSEDDAEGPPEDDAALAGASWSAGEEQRLRDYLRRQPRVASSPDNVKNLPFWTRALAELGSLRSPLALYERWIRKLKHAGASAEKEETAEEEEEEEEGEEEEEEGDEEEEEEEEGDEGMEGTSEEAEAEGGEGASGHGLVWSASELSALDAFLRPVRPLLPGNPGNSASPQENRRFWGRAAAAVARASGRACRSALGCYKQRVFCLKHGA
jgi:hypothetical protein